MKVALAALLAAYSLVYGVSGAHADTHPVDSQGFVVDGSPQLDDAHCVGTPQDIAACLTARRYTDWSDQVGCLDAIIDRESGWDVTAANPDGAYGLPQALPGDKMASEGPDWPTEPRTQLRWMLDYITRYGTPCDAWAFWQAHFWY